MNLPPLTDRQIQILKYIIEEFIISGSAIGSDTLDRKYNLGVSPATIRNEMVMLVQQGYLTQEHTSSGRIPTPQSIKFYISQLMEEQDLSVAEEVSVKAKIWDVREEVDQLLISATQSLAEKSGAIAATVTDQGSVYHSGYANILDIPEFFDIDVTKTVLSLIDDHQQLIDFFNKSTGDEPIHVMLGDDFDNKYLYNCGLLYTNLNLGQYGKGKLGIIGPSRIDYSHMIPMLRYFGRLINEIAMDW